MLNSPLAKKYMELHELIGENMPCIDQKNDNGDRIILFANRRKENPKSYYIDLSIGGHYIEFNRDSSTGKFVIPLPGYEPTQEEEKHIEWIRGQDYELDEEETKAVLSIFEKLYDGDLNIKVEDFPTKFVERRKEDMKIQEERVRKRKERERKGKYNDAQPLN